MASFTVQVEALAGPADGYNVDQWLDDAVKDIVDRIAKSAPEQLEQFGGQAGHSDNGSGVGVSGHHRIINVVRGSKVATRIPASNRFEAANNDSLLFASEEYPVWYLRNGNVYILPATTSGAVGSVDVAKYGTVSDTSTPSISNFPVEYFPMVVIYASTKLLHEKLVGYSLPPAISLPSVPVLALPSLPAVPTLPSVPVAPVINLSLVSSLSTVTMPDSVSLPEFVSVADPIIDSLDLSNVTPPPVPDPPVFVIGDAALQQEYDSTRSITLGTAPPDYAPPVMTAPDWSDADDWVSDATKGEDPEMVQARMAVINGQIQEFSTKLQDSLNKFNEDNAKYQAENQSDLTEWQSNTQALVEKMSLSTNVDLQNKAQDLQRHIQEYASTMQRYQAEMSKYQADLNELVVVWTSNQMQVEFAKWQTKFQQELGAYQAKVGSILQEYQADISKESGLTQAEVAKYSAELQEESTKINSELTKYQAEVSTYSTEVQSTLNLYSTETQSKLSSYTQEAQTKLSAYGQEVQAIVQDFTTQMQKAQTDYQWMQSQLQYLATEYEKKFAVPAQQQQQEQGK
jgi:hypothetical protein